MPNPFSIICWSRKEMRENNVRMQMQFQNNLGEKGNVTAQFRKMGQENQEKGFYKQGRQFTDTPSQITRARRKAVLKVRKRRSHIASFHISLHRTKGKSQPGEGRLTGGTDGAALKEPFRKGL